MNILLLCFVAFCTFKTIVCDDPIVEVEQGLLRGKLQDAVVGGYQFYSFENVPYAKPPVGDLRFKAPEEPESWEGVRDATALGPMCPQFSPLTGILKLGSEDCLSANIYTRNLTGKAPVIVYMSGFAYFFDGDYENLYGADYLVKDLVVVTFNHRKDVLGFLNLGIKDVPGNAALRDQVLLLEWVQKNIAAFGGDPDSVTLAGLSSGSAAIAHHLMSPLSTGLFHRAIMLSGVPTCDAILSYKVKEKSFLLGKQLGYDGESAEELLSYLQSLPYEDLIYKMVYVSSDEEKHSQLLKKMSTFVPVIEEDFGQDRFISEDIASALENGLVNKVEVLIGYSDQEALIVVNQYADYMLNLFKNDPLLFVPNKILYQEDIEDKKLAIANSIKEYYLGDKEVSVDNMKEFVQCNSHSCMIYDVLKFAQKVSKLTDTYLLKFSSVSSRNVYGNEGQKYGITGASHGDTVLYMFDPKPLNMVVSADSEEYALITQFVGSLSNFAATGKPSADCPQFDVDSQNYVEFTDSMTCKQGPNSDDIAFWDSIYEQANHPIYPY
ncbi:juvenile hormone esterase-like [Spodoptera litura]|uniref:Carboxylic ester hydrolase n=1 Tax=Spodoptera litura TaxID=69820 RepID=A0A9J7ITR2_SPOLT|nr:juvenile hormone esterase-like [Spodoptera litura]